MSGPSLEFTRRTRLPQRPLGNADRTERREGGRFRAGPGGLPLGHGPALGALGPYWGLEGPQQEMAKQMFFPSSVLNGLKAQRNFQWLRVGVLGLICLTKYKTDFSSCSHRACEGAGPGMSVGQRPPFGSCWISEEHLW